MTDWATVSDVLTYTGLTVESAEVLRAQAIIELFAGAGATVEGTSDDANIVGGYNLRLLKKAVAYQAGWMTEHPDVFTNVDVTNFSQDGASASQGHANAALLAPLAKRCLDRLTWNLSPLKAHHRRQPWYNTGNRDSAVRDDELPWIPLPGSAQL